jgi:hypothetical protein
VVIGLGEEIKGHVVLPCQIALRLLEPGYGEFLEGEDAQAAESELENTVQSFCTALIERAEAEAARLPPEGRAKLAAERDGDWNDDEVSATVESEAGGTTTERRSVVQAVVKGERRLEKAVKRFAPIVKAKVEVTAHTRLHQIFRNLRIMRDTTANGRMSLRAFLNSSLCRTPAGSLMQPPP